MALPHCNQSHPSQTRPPALDGNALHTFTPMPGSVCISTPGFLGGVNDVSGLVPWVGKVPLVKDKVSRLGAGKDPKMTSTAR